MRKIVIVVAAALTGSVLFSSAAQGRHESGMRFYEHDTAQTNIDLGETGQSPGDRFIFSGDLFDRKGGDKRGGFAGNCETLRTGSDGLSLCTTSFLLEGGQITSTGVFDTSALFGGERVTFPITGGTGRYRNVRGYGTVEVPTDVPNQTDANFVLRLS